jgi:hypothetical protein
LNQPKLLPTPWKLPGAALFATVQLDCRRLAQWRQRQKAEAWAPQQLRMRWLELLLQPVEALEAYREPRSRDVECEF